MAQEAYMKVAVLAVAMAVRLYVPAASGVVVKLNGTTVTEPNRSPLLRNYRLVTEPLALVAVRVEV